MPELHFSIQWPDGTTQTCYSPSTIVRNHFTPATQYTITEFLLRSRSGLFAASERVRERFGAPCSLALAQLANIEATATRYSADALVAFKSFKE